MIMNLLLCRPYIFISASCLINTPNSRMIQSVTANRETYFGEKKMGYQVQCPNYLLFNFNFIFIRTKLDNFGFIV